MQGFLADFSMLLLGVISGLLILVVLLQRGRGGGLAGAFGGLGGQSAFGTKAGDVFTKITIGLVTAWVLLAGVSGVLARKASVKGDFADTDTAAAIDEKDSDETGDGMSSMSTGDDEGTTIDDSATDNPAGDSTSDDARLSDDKGTEAASTEESETAAPSESETEAKPADANDDKE
ncbi:MAG: preprotein translocase subunit SecG [Planctomycetaceae bacterium]|jgi:preprotein translocase subunit SecG